ncbi:MAG: oligosaccharide flippase family protein [Planctomycetota bacterium]
MGRREKQRPAGAAASLGDRTAAGFAWLIVQTLGSRGVSLVSQLALAAMVSERAFGLMALARTALSLMELMQNIGLRDILIQRSHKVGLWVPHAQHVGLIVGGAASLLTLAAAPVAAYVYDEPGVVGVVLVLALSPLLRAQINIAQAVLRAEMRFRAVAALELSSTLVLAASGLTLAALSAEEYALAVPVSLAALVQLIVGNRLAGIRFSTRFRPRRWRMLVTSGGILFASRVCVVILLQADYAVLGLLYTAAEVGVYYFAFTLSTQGIRMVAMNVIGVLLPALSTMTDDPGRVLAAFLRSVRAIAVLAVPFGLLQAGLVEPVVALLFPGKWEGLAELVQVLSIGMVASIIGITTSSVLLSQRRYWTVLMVEAGQCVLFLGLVIPAAVLGDMLWVAGAVAVFHAISAPVRVFVSVRPIGGGVADAAGIFVGPLAGGLLGSAAGLAAGTALVGEWPLGDWIGALVSLVVALGVYAAVVCVVCRPAVAEILSRFRSMLRRVRG